MFNKPIKSLVALSLSAAMLTSCASLFTKSSQEITFKGVPGTVIVDKKKNRPIAEIGSNGFATAEVRKQLGSKELHASKDGYTPADYELGTKIQGWFWGNLVLGGIPGMAIDAATGKMKKYKTDMLDVTLQPVEGWTEEVVEEEIVVPNMPQTVSRKNPGATDAEKAIVRWYIDSDPAAHASTGVSSPTSPTRCTTPTRPTSPPHPSRRPAASTSRASTTTTPRVSPSKSR